MYACPYCGHNHTHLAADSTPADDAEWQRVIEAVFAGQLKTGAIDVPTAVATAQDFMQAVYQGFGDNFSTVDYNTPDYGLLQALETNVFQFSGAKNYQQLKALNDLLRDGERMRGRAEFKYEAQKLVDEWNGVWKDTEYNTAANSGLNARKWQDFQQYAKQMPLLKFVGVGDDRECPICLPFNNMVRPIDDPVWRYAMPTLHFNCRDTVFQLPTADVAVTPDELVPTADGIPPMFRVNLAEEQLVFPPGHPYYDGVPKKVLKNFVKQNKPDRNQ